MAAFFVCLAEVSNTAAKSVISGKLRCSILALWGRFLRTIFARYFITATIELETKMKAMRAAVVALLPLAAQWGWCGDLTTDAAIGGAIGGALGGVVGAQVGGREGAVVGAGVGGAAGAAIATQGDGGSRRDSRDGRYYEERYYEDEHHHHHDHFCPPGQGKKGRC